MGIFEKKKKRFLEQENSIVIANRDRWMRERLAREPAGTQGETKIERLGDTILDYMFKFVMSKFCFGPTRKKKPQIFATITTS
jgi:hypothetical protein